MEEEGKSKGLDYIDIITGNMPDDIDAWREYQEFYVKRGFSHVCTYEWYRDMIRPYRKEYENSKDIK